MAAQGAGKNKKGAPKTFLKVESGVYLANGH
jgi:hypothetical protein